MASIAGLYELARKETAAPVDLHQKKNADQNNNYQKEKNTNPTATTKTTTTPVETNVKKERTIKAPALPKPVPVPLQKQPSRQQASPLPLPSPTPSPSPIIARVKQTKKKATPEQQPVSENTPSFLSQYYSSLASSFASSFAFPNNSRQQQQQYYEDLICPTLATMVLTLLLSILWIIKKRRQRKLRHSQLYGDHVFPPFASVAKLSCPTAAPWFFSKCADQVGTNIFRLQLGGRSIFGSNSSNTSGGLGRCPFASRDDADTNDTHENVVVVVGDLELAKEMLQDPLSTTRKPQFDPQQRQQQDGFQGSLYKSVADLIGGPNLYTSNDNRWKQARNGVLPALSCSHKKKKNEPSTKHQDDTTKSLTIKQTPIKPTVITPKPTSSSSTPTTMDRMNHVCTKVTEQWIQSRLEPSIRNNKPLPGQDLSQEVRRMTLQIFCQVAFGYSLLSSEGDAKDTEVQEILQALDVASQEFLQDKHPVWKAISASSSSSSSSPFSSWCNSWLSLVIPSSFQYNRKARAAKNRLRKFATKMLETHRERNKQTTKSKYLRRRRRNPDQRERDDKNVPVKTILSCIDKNIHYADDNDRISDILAFLIAGQDTTAHTVSWILLELAQNTADQQKLRSALRGSDDALAQQVLKDVIREGMRLHPVYPIIGMRTLGRDFYTKDNIVIPKGSHVLFPTMMLTRDSNKVAHAEAFLPSRWAKPDMENFSFLLFGTGKRNCVGQSLALAQITWILSRLCAQYEFNLVEKDDAQNEEEDGEKNTDYAIFRGGTIQCAGAQLQARKVVSSSFSSSLPSVIPQ